MNDTQTQNFQPEQFSESSESASTVPREKTLKRIVIVVVALVVVSCLCLIVCVAAGGWGAISGIIKAAQERDNVASVLDTLLQAMADENAEAAYALFSTRSQRTTSLGEIEALLQGNNFALFDGYKSITITNLGLKKAFNTNPDLPQGTIAEVAGTVTYEGGFTGTLTAVLEQENGRWKVSNFRITVSPDKLGSP